MPSIVLVWFNTYMVKSEFRFHGLLTNKKIVVTKLASTTYKPAIYCSGVTVGKPTMWLSTQGMAICFTLQNPAKT